MGLKIKWNDDRVRGATTAILLIGRDRLHRGEAEDLIQASLADYRNDPEGYKANKAIWAGARELGPLTNPGHLAHYRNLISAVDALLEKMARGKRQFNSLLELDNSLVASLAGVRLLDRHEIKGRAVLVPVGAGSPLNRRRAGGAKASGAR